MKVTVVASLVLLLLDLLVVVVVVRGTHVQKGSSSIGKQSLVRSLYGVRVTWWKVLGHHPLPSNSSF